MAKWTVRQVLTENRCFRDPDHPLYFGSSETITETPVSEWHSKNQTFTHQTADAKENPIKEIRIEESRPNSAGKLQRREIHVKFNYIQYGQDRQLNRLVELFNQNKMDTILDYHYEYGTKFIANDTRELRRVLSTLNSIAPFSDEMKVALIAFLCPQLSAEEAAKSSLVQSLFVLIPQTKSHAMYQQPAQVANEAPTVSASIASLSN